MTRRVIGRPTCEMLRLSGTDTTACPTGAARPHSSLDSPPYSCRRRGHHARRLPPLAPDRGLRCLRDRAVGGDRLGRQSGPDRLPDGYRTRLVHRRTQDRAQDLYETIPTQHHRERAVRELRHVLAA